MPDTFEVKKRLYRGKFCRVRQNSCSAEQPSPTSILPDWEFNFSQCVFPDFSIPRNSPPCSRVNSSTKVAEGGHSLSAAACFAELRVREEDGTREGVIDKERISRHVLSISGVGQERRRRRGQRRSELGPDTPRTLSGRRSFSPRLLTSWSRIPGIRASLSHSTENSSN